MAFAIGQPGESTSQNIMTTQTKPVVTEREYSRLEKQVVLLLKSLKPDIGDEYRACEDDNIPGMCVTIGATPQSDGVLSWSYQTGDNSYTGGAYGHHHWGVVYLYRRSNCKELAHQAVEEIAESIGSSKLTESDRQAWESTTKVYRVEKPFNSGEEFHKL